MRAFRKPVSRNRCTEGSRYLPVKRPRAPLLSAFRGKVEEIQEPHLQIRGSREMEVDECRSVLSCDGDLVKLLLRGMTLTVLGVGLSVEEFTVSTVMIRGDIRSLELEPVGRKGAAG